MGADFPFSICHFSFAIQAVSLQAMTNEKFEMTNGKSLLG
jgi:hypothetical protein